MSFLRRVASHVPIVQRLFNYLSKHQNLLVLNVKRRNIPARDIRPQDLTLEVENIEALKLICLVNGKKLIEAHTTFLRTRTAKTVLCSSF